MVRHRLRESVQSAVRERLAQIDPLPGRSGHLLAGRLFASREYRGLCNSVECLYLAALGGWRAGVRRGRLRAAGAGRARSHPSTRSVALWRPDGWQTDRGLCDAASIRVRASCLVNGFAEGRIAAPECLFDERAV